MMGSIIKKMKRLNGIKQNIYNALSKESNYIECARILARSERDYSPEEEWRKPKPSELLHAASTMLEYSELLGDENLIAKYNAMVEKYKAMKEELESELEDPSFVFEE